MVEAAAFKKRLASNGPAFGCWLELFSPLAAEIVAQAGYDCVLIDLEHGPGSYLDAIALMHAVQARPCAPLLRVPANELVAIKRALDIGVAGLMIPSVNDAAQAAAAVAACCYAPKGGRGMAASIVRASDYGARWRDYVAEAEASLLVMCQIESAAAVGNAAEIAAVPGVDLLFVGPFDLSASTGHLGEPDHPAVRAMIGEVERAAKAAGRLLGGIPTPARSAADLVAAGYDLIMAAADVSLLREAASDNLAALRAAARAVR